MATPAMVKAAERVIAQGGTAADAIDAAVQAAIEAPLVLPGECLEVGRQVIQKTDLLHLFGIPQRAALERYERRATA